MSIVVEHVLVLEVCYAPQDKDAQPLKLFRVHGGDREAAIRENVTPKVYAYRFYEKDVRQGWFLASESDRQNTTPWYFRLGTLMSFEQLLEQHVITPGCVEYWRGRNRTRAVMLAPDFLVFIKDEDVLLDGVEGR